MPTETAKQSWLECQLDRGMFSDEMAVTYPPDGPVLCSVFVPASDVRGQPGTKGKVRVIIVKRQGKVLAALPTSERTIVPVEEGDLTDSPFTPDLQEQSHWN